MTLYYKSCESQPQTLLKKYYFDGPCAISSIGLFNPLYVTNHQYKLCIREIKIIKSLCIWNSKRIYNRYNF